MHTFGEFRFDVISGELWRRSERVKLQPALARLLTQFVSRPNEFIERAELVSQVWPAGVFVDSENSLNNAVARLRRVIGAHWIEVLPKRGYRFRQRVRSARRRVDPVVERACTLGLHFWNRTTAASLDRAVASFNDAIARDPGHAEGWAGLAETYLLLGDDVVSGMPPQTALDRARSAAGRALDRSPDCARALAVHGMVLWRSGWDWKEAERHLRAAIAMDRSASTPHVYYAWLLRATGRANHAEAEIARALELSPVSSFVSANAGLMLYFGRRYSDAIAHLHQTLTLDEHYPLAYLALGLAFSAVRESEKAVQSLQGAVRLAGNRVDYYGSMLGYALAAGNHNTPEEFVNGRAFDRALVHLGRGEIGPSVDCLEVAFAEPSSHFAYLGVDPLFDRLRREKRFRNLTKSIGIP